MTEASVQTNLKEALVYCADNGPVPGLIESYISYSVIGGYFKDPVP
jgi:hypothetical protein